MDGAGTSWNLQQSKQLGIEIEKNIPVDGASCLRLFSLLACFQSFE